MGEWGGGIGELVMWGDGSGQLPDPDGEEKGIGEKWGVVAARVRGQGIRE